MIFFLPVVFLAALASVVFLLAQSVRIAFTKSGRWPGWWRALAGCALASGAAAVASYAMGALVLMTTVVVAQDGGADSAPFPSDHPCRAKLRGAVDYEVDFRSLRTVCVMGDGERRDVEDVPQRVRVTAAASAAGTALLGGIALASRERLSARAGRVPGTPGTPAPRNSPSGGRRS
ncbi:hypothetical protein ACF064_27280 [Streptomyces sp. NPDC015492]|uniref:hypothetical protein n=1 Tax=Streptomyces sp. NPDC015492 TaxID=3364958 RepID=UPI0036FA96CC